MLDSIGWQGSGNHEGFCGDAAQVEEGSFTDSEILVMLGENGTGAPLHPSFPLLVHPFMVPSMEKAGWGKPQLERPPHQLGDLRS